MRVLARFVAPASSLRVDAETGSGFRLTIDSGSAEPPAGPAPREMVLAGLATCTGMDVASILAKKRQVPDAYQVTVEAQLAPDPPRVFTRIVIEHRVEGAVEPEALRRAVELSATRYCPVSAMLSRAVVLEHRYRLIQPGQAVREVLVVVTAPDGEPRGVGRGMHSA